MQEYPNILIINEQSIDKDNATGITLRSILDSWPIDNLMELYIDKSNIKSNRNSKCVLDCFPIQKIMRNHSSSEKKIPYVEDNGSPSKKNIVKLRIRRLLINFADLSMMKITENIYCAVEDFKPNVIYTLAGSVSVMKMSVKLAKCFDVPIVIHFMDDWSHYLQDENGLGQRVYKKKLHQWLKKSYEHSNICLTISPQMAEEYQKETGIRHVALMNSINIDGLRCTLRKNCGELIFTYAGGLHLERWKALLDIQRCIEKCTEKCHKKAKLVIYSKMQGMENIVAKFNPEITEFRTYVPHDEIKQVYENASVLVHAEVSDPLLLGYFRFSISTKIPEYLATGKPVLFYGPKEMGLSKYLRDNMLAYVASSENELDEKIDYLINTFDEASSNVCQSAIDYVKKNHDINSARDLFKSVIVSAISYC